MANETLLNITGPGIQPYSARGIKQTLAPIAQASQLRRTINGVLLDLADTVFRKYRSTISAADGQPPAFDGMWPGLLLTVDCAAYLSYKTSGGTPSRTVVSGSSYVDGSYTFYRPQMSMRVIGWSQDEDEWGATVGWQLELEEA